MSFGFRPVLGRWFGENWGSGFSLLILLLAQGFAINGFSQEQSAGTAEEIVEATASSEQPSNEVDVEPTASPDSSALEQSEPELQSEATQSSVTESSAFPATESREVDNSEFQRVVVAESFVNLMSGPGRGFPIFYVAEQKESVWILLRKNNWFKVRIAKNREGWVHISDMQKMLNPDGSSVSFKQLTEADFERRAWELGFRAGDFEGAKVLALTAGWQATPNLSAEFVLGQGLGDFSETQQASVSVANSPFPDWVVSPHFGVGIGVIRTLPSASLVQETDRQDEVLFVTAGARTYITDRFLFRVDYRNYVVLTTQETNEEVDEWTIGFSVFF